MTRRRPRSQRGHAAKAGLPPGTPIYTGTSTDVPISAGLISYTEERYDEQALSSLSEIEPESSGTKGQETRWFDFIGLHDSQAIASVCERFGLHPLAVEDVLSTEGRPKVDDYGETLFLTAKILASDPVNNRASIEHVALVLGDGWVLSFQERPGDPFEPVRKRIRTSAGRVRRKGADYLFHLLIDALVDAAFVVTAHLEDQIDTLEEEVLRETLRSPGRAVHSLRGEVRKLRRTLAPMRLALTTMLRDEPKRLGPDLRPYTRDVLDHLDLLLDRLESSRERLTSTLEVHLATTSQKTNEVMRGLTVVATVFIPLTFIAGVYGMNFEWMPELGWWWAYPVILTLMLLIAIGMLLFMRQRGWLGAAPSVTAGSSSPASPQHRSDPGAPPPTD